MSGSNLLVHRGYYVGTALLAPLAALVLVVLMMAPSETTLAQTNGPAQYLFVANLVGASEVPVNESLATGRAVMTLVTDTLYYRVEVADIEGVILAHIHEGAVGDSGPPIFTLFDGTGAFDPSTPISGSVVLTPTQITALLTSNYYVNVHTDAYPGGEIRGQLEEFTPPASYLALLLGSEETPPVETGAAGVAKITLGGLTTITYEVTVSDIPTITLAHIHRAPRGVGGPPVITLYDGTGTFDEENPLVGTTVITGAGLVDLLTGFWYVNVHTEENGGGEIRGQIETSHLFEANLAGAHEEDQIDTPATGRAVLALDGDGESLAFRVSVSDIDDIFNAHLHKGEVGVSGPVAVELYTPPFDASHPLSGTVPLSSTQVMDLIRGLYYVNVHTDVHSGGEIRGQVYSYAPSRHRNALLTPENEVPPVEGSEAVGLARLTLSEDADTLQYTVFVTDIVDVTASHIHIGPRGVNGPVRHIVFNDAGGGVFDADNPVGGGAQLSAQDLVDLLTGFAYVNVHTDAHSGGEIRGQIGGVQLYQAALTGADEVADEPISTEATGRAVLALSADTSELAYRVTVNDIDDVTASHIHRAPEGVNGPIVFPLFPPPDVFDESHPISGTLAISTARVLDLIAGRYYVNVHSSDYPGGEIRGQVNPYAIPTHLHALMTSGEESPPSTNPDAVGVARFTLDDETGVVQYSVAVSNTNPISMAHIHRAPDGVNGPVIVPIFNETGGGAFGPGVPIADGIEPDHTGWVDLLTHWYYVNVHTAANLGGEMRGQIGGASVFASELSPENETEEVDSAASGTAIWGLNAGATSLSFRIQVEEIDNITAAHIHPGAAGEDNPPLVNLFTGGTFDPSHPLSGTVETDTPLLFLLLGDRLYANVHTTDFPDGEIRDQIVRVTPPTDFVALLDPSQEPGAAAVTQNPAGTGLFTLEPGMALLHYSISVTDIVSITLAHIHLGPPGVNGPVVHNLYTGDGPFDPDNPIGGLLQLDGADLVNLLTDFYYVNVHTETEPAGAIRGQIRPVSSLFVPSLTRN